MIRFRAGQPRKGEMFCGQFRDKPNEVARTSLHCIPNRYRRLVKAIRAQNILAQRSTSERQRERRSRRRKKRTWEEKKKSGAINLQREKLGKRCFATTRTTRHAIWMSRLIESRAYTDHTTPSRLPDTKSRVHPSAVGSPHARTNYLTIAFAFPRKSHN